MSEEKEREVRQEGAEAPGAEANGQERGPSGPEGGPARWRLALVLVVVCAAAGGALAAGHALTKERIERQRYLFKLSSVRRALPDCENDPGKDLVRVTAPDGTRLTFYRCRRQGRVVAAAFSVDSEKNKNRPYGGTIEILMGVGADGRLVVRKGLPGLVVLRHTETPGLGAKMEEKEFLSNFVGPSGLGRNLAGDGRSCDPKAGCRTWAVTKDDPEGFVDAISGATITSRAVTEMVRRGIEYIREPSIWKKVFRTDPPAARRAASRMEGR